MANFKKNVIVVTAPSGTGKTTLNRALVRESPDIEISISLTTRALRAGEVNGDHYWFVSHEQFAEAVRQGKMLESAEVFGNFYGTSLDEVERITGKNKRVLLEIDVQGWLQARNKLPGAISIFILPPSIKDLWLRLQKRGTDSLAVRWRRINAARKELDYCSEYEFFVINDNLEEASKELKRLVQKDNKQAASRLSHAEGLEHSRRLIEEFDQAAWLQDIRAEVEKTPPSK